MFPEDIADIIHKNISADKHNYLCSYFCIGPHMKQFMQYWEFGYYCTVRSGINHPMVYLQYDSCHYTEIMIHIINGPYCDFAIYNIVNQVKESNNLALFQYLTTHPRMNHWPWERFGRECIDLSRQSFLLWLICTKPDEFIPVVQSIYTKMYSRGYTGPYTDRLSEQLFHINQAHKSLMYKKNKTKT